MKIDEISFNDAWVKTKTEDEFVKEFIGMDHIYPDAKDKAAKLKAVYQEHQPKAEVEFKPLSLEQNTGTREFDTDGGVITGDKE